MAHDLHVRLIGSGPMVVWLHAFPLHGAMWHPQWEELEGFQHLIPDLPGFGDSPRVSDCLTMDDAADRVADLVSRCTDQAAIIAGCSMGGYVALAFARRHPRWTRALILCDTRAGSDDDEDRKRREEAAAELLKHGPSVLEPMLEHLVVQGDSRVGRQVASWLRQVKPAGAAAAFRGMARRLDQRGFVKTLNLPCLLLVGEHDPFTPPEEMKELARGISGSWFSVIDDAAHLPNLEQPDATNAVLKRFLTSLDAPEAGEPSEKDPGVDWIP